MNKNNELNIIKTHVPNFKERENGIKIDMIIIHHTGSKDYEGVMKIFNDLDSKVSAHYMIDRKGNIFELVDVDKCAWHAGFSRWNRNSLTDNEYININERSIGIELLNEGHLDYTDPQIGSLIKLCKKLKTDYDIPQDNILGHSDIAPSRKQDPSAEFPWDKMAKNGLGLYHDKVSLKDNFNSSYIIGINNNKKIISKIFKDIGYHEGFYSNRSDLKSDFNNVVEAFQRHFVSSELISESKGRVTKFTLASALAVQRKYTSFRNKYNAS